jgi:type II restriction enzyme
MKNRGTNDLRLKEDKKKQAKGNAIERLGKNVIGLRAALLNEAIFPFICFGDGCDFAKDSSVLDKVITISMFGKLNIIRVHSVYYYFSNTSLRHSLPVLALLRKPLFGLANRR